MVSLLSPAAQKTRHEEYRPDVDGLRAIAVLIVVLFHAELGFSGGYVGVDVFFVISGFLICRLILKDLNDGKFTLRGFWERRIRRIFPALTVVVAATLVTGCVMLFPQDLMALAKSSIAQGSLLSNVYFCFHMGYFDAAAGFKPLLHTWSLAVEEQFYMFFPLLLLLLSRMHAGKFKVLCWIGIISFIISAIGAYTFKTPNFFLLPGRAWELMLGALLAINGPGTEGNHKRREAAGWTGIALIAFAALAYDGAVRFPGIAALPPCVGTALVIWSSQSNRQSVVGKILALRPLVFVGLISYSLYLWHWPALVFARYSQASELSVPTRLLVVLTSIVLAIITWKWIEQPFRRKLIFKTQPQIFTFFATATAVLLVAGVVVYRAHGFQSRFSPDVLAYMNYADMTKDAKEQKRGFLNVSLEDAAAGKLGKIGVRDTNEPPTVAVWGDSHAMVMSPAVDEICRKHGKRGVQATHAATPPVLDFASFGAGSLGNGAIKFNSTVFDYFREKHIGNVILIARWSRDIDNAEFRTALTATVGKLRAAGMKVYLVKDVPAAEFDVPHAAALTAMRGGDVNQLGVPQKAYENENRKVDDLFRQLAAAGVTVLDPTPYFPKTNGVYRVAQDHQLLYVDSHHLSLEGAKVVSPVFEQMFAKQATEQVSSLR